VNKAGINATLPSETAVLGAANPKHGRWDDHIAEHDQIDIDPALVSRFALIWKLTDKPDEERDRSIGDKMLRTADVAKRIQLPDQTVSDADRGDIEPELAPEFLRKYIAYARSNFTPVFRDDAVRERMNDAYVSLRGANGYDEDAAVPVTPRKLDDALRLAEASARARLSPVIEEQDVERAQRLIGNSLRQFGVNDDGDLDVDTVETGTSKTQKQRREGLKDLIAEHQPNSGPLGVDDLVDIAQEELGLAERTIRDEVEAMVKAGEAYQPGAEGTVRVFRS
jgi:replicative DNA helicase Mcm